MDTDEFIQECNRIINELNELSRKYYVDYFNSDCKSIYSYYDYKRCCGKIEGVTLARDKYIQYIVNKTALRLTPKNFIG